MLGTVRKSFAAALRRSLAAAWFVWVLFSHAASAWAQDEPATVNIRGTETFIGEYVGDNGEANEGAYGDDDQFWIFRNLLYLQAGNRDFDSGLRLDATLFHSPPARIDPGSFVPGGTGYTTLDYDNDFRLERIFGTVHLGNLHLTAGDFYVNFGRGIALSMIKLDDIGVDNALRGARIEYHVPRSIKAILVGGVVNASNVDPLTRAIQREDPLDRIAGARVQWELLDALSLGVHGVLMAPRFERESAVADDRRYVDRSTSVSLMTAGATFEAHLGGWHLYLEGNAQSHDDYRPVGEEDIDDETGVAAFGEVSYDLPPWNLKAEGIFYRKWLMEGPYRGSAPGRADLATPLTYHHMVTLEPMWMIIKSFGNVYGGKLTGDLYLDESDTHIKLSSSLLRYLGGLLPTGQWDDHPPTNVVHPAVEVRQTLGTRKILVSAQGGFRYEWTKEPDFQGEDTGSLWHVQGDVTVPLGGPHSLEVKGELRRHELVVTEGPSEQYWVTSTGLGYDRSGLFGLSAVHEFSDQTGGSRAQIGSLELPLPRRHYVWFLASVHPPRPLDGLTFRLLGGSQRGGIKCAGGICRTYPDAVGVKAEAVYRF